MIKKKNEKNKEVKEKKNPKIKERTASWPLDILICDMLDHFGLLHALYFIVAL